MNPLQQHLTIQQISKRLKIPKPTLRFWEKEFEGILVPLRTRGGQRRYTAEHISVIEEINNLKRKRMSLAEVKDELQNNKKAKSGNSIPKGMDLLAERIAEVVKEEVYRFLVRQEE